MLGKIANIFSQNVNNLAGGVFNNQATNAAAAKILNKSPLEISNTPASALANNPYEYGEVYYPSEIANLGTGHYMIFDIIMHKHSKFKNKTSGSVDLTGIDDLGQVGESQSSKGAARAQLIKNNNLQKRLVKVDSGIQKLNNTHTHVSDSIILYTDNNFSAGSRKLSYPSSQNLSKVLNLSSLTENSFLAFSLLISNLIATNLFSSFIRLNLISIGSKASLTE